MASETVHVFTNKYSNAEIVRKAVKILTVIENHLSENPPCEHCTRMLKDFYRIE